MINLLAAVIVIVNGQTMNFDQPPIEQAGRVFVPLRGIFEQLGASVVYQNGTINATGRGHTVSLQIGSTQATVNGQTQTLDSPPFVTGSRTLVPLRFVATALGASVDWNNDTSTVTITGSGSRGGGYNAPPRPPANPGAYVVDRAPLDFVQGAMPTVSARFSVPVRIDTVHITVDGFDATQWANVSSNGFRYAPRRPLAPGHHTVRVSGVTRDGASFSTSWDFRT